MSVWDAGTNWQFHQTVNVYQSGTLCKLTRSLYWWLQSSGGAEMPVWRKEFLVRPLNAFFFHDGNMGTKTDQMWICMVCMSLCECVCVQRWGFHYSFSWPRKKVIAGWFCHEVKSVVLHVGLLLFCVGFLKKQQVLPGYGDREDRAESDRRKAPFIDVECWKHESNSCVMYTLEEVEEEVFRSFN